MATLRQAHADIDKFGTVVDRCVTCLGPVCGTMDIRLQSAIEGSVHNKLDKVRLAEGMASTVDGEWKSLQLEGSCFPHRLDAHVTAMNVKQLEETGIEHRSERIGDLMSRYAHFMDKLQLSDPLLLRVCVRRPSSSRPP